MRGAGGALCVRVCVCACARAVLVGGHLLHACGGVRQGRRHGLLPVHAMRSLTFVCVAGALLILSLVATGGFLPRAVRAPLVPLRLLLLRRARRLAPSQQPHMLLKRAVLRRTMRTQTLPPHSSPSRGLRRFPLTEWHGDGRPHRRPVVHTRLSSRGSRPRL
jgi:hypothetical protein